MFVVAGRDYGAINNAFLYTDDNRRLCITIRILDNDEHDKNKKFFLYFHEVNGCIPDQWAEICIRDDEWGECILTNCYFKEHVPIAILKLATFMQFHTCTSL